MRYAMVIDLDKCIGCQTCAVVCKMHHAQPQGTWWNRVFTQGSEYHQSAVGSEDGYKIEYLPVSCQMCDNAPCERVCPTGATYKDEMGRVEIDYDKCIGCRMCMAACPYNARTFNWAEPVRDVDFNYGDARVPVRGRGVMEKCTLCKERTDDGDAPMCVMCCPTKARVFGDLDDPNSEISKLRRSGNVRVLLEEMGTKPQVFYVNR